MKSWHYILAPKIGKFYVQNCNMGMNKYKEHHSSFQETRKTLNPMILLYIFLTQIFHITDLEIISYLTAACVSLSHPEE